MKIEQCPARLIEESSSQALRIKLECDNDCPLNNSVSPFRIILSREMRQKHLLATINGMNVSRGLSCKFLKPNPESFVTEKLSFG